MSLAKIVWSEARIATPHTIGTPPGMDEECDFPAFGRNWPARRGLASSSSFNGRKSEATMPFEYQDAWERSPSSSLLWIDLWGSRTLQLTLTWAFTRLAGIRG